MAFRVPTQAPRRRTSYSTPQRPPPIDIPPSPTEQQEDDTTQWVLFSPTARTHTTSTEHTRTVGASRLSDFGSFGTATRSAAGQEGEAYHDEALDDQLDEDGTELDSLDDGLQAFRAPSLSPVSPARMEQGPPAMLPAHDGLGSFQASSLLAQEQLWQHEQYNPQRRQSGYPTHRRRSSVQRYLDTVDEGEADVERDRWHRIEQWRMDQSRAFLQEIERETRRRRSSHASQSTIPRSIAHSSPSGVSAMPSETASAEPHAEIDDESFWRRITRKVIRDLIGIDDTLLSVILGESLPSEAISDGQAEELDMETVLAQEPEPSHVDAPLWQTQVLQRIAHELGILVHQICEHPGAFTTYYQMTKDVSSEYAGMSLDRLAESGVSQRLCEPTTQTSVDTPATDSMPSPHFIPTIGDANREHEAQWGIEDDDPISPEPVSESTRLQQEQQYWERGLDVMMVFRYLRTRFGRRGYMTNDNYTSNSSPRHTQDASRRAAIIRQHHPLVARAHSRSQNQPRRASQYSGVSGPAGLSAPLARTHIRRPSSSCASQSKLSAISSRRTLTGSSRNYWDIGGSVDSNSAIGVGAGFGTWGEA
ncbi:hypothetical protein N7462_009075 [Penicillium macrosclerotiorum]|uniref:uncharacterized protein n=1 Tax=Penicillium macrosclerotiorum TaxID=303699 RepID=UPI0025475F1D|nr:uncharacterized protein N7462_009075 [Penicillium macrosclerotiorum]KAJ5676178.1 hypothetical protein N7462_009075 [Penicillium macrosclerotiorum]